MISPDYDAPDSLDAALRLKKNLGDKARIIAGGTDLILRLRSKIFTPDMLIDLRHLSMNTISIDSDKVYLGSCVTHAQILNSDILTSNFPALVEACRQFAGPPIRNRGTVGGNIVNSSPAADLVPPLLVYDADIVLTSSSSVRVLPLCDFFTGPGKNVMKADEILTEIHLPLPAADTVANFIKLGQRRSMAISIVNLACRITVSESNIVNTARIALGAVAPTPIRAMKAENIFVGETFSDALVESAAQLASEEISPISDSRASKDYRVKMTRVLVRRALMTMKDELESTH
jgi:aerobic carbon-monoxide dehydrogenase medium subunit